MRALVLLLICFDAWAQKPVHLIVPAAAGGPTDIIARVFAPALAERLGQPVVVENKGGAGGIIGSDAVAKAPPDGNTLGLVFISHATNPALHARLPYDTLADFTPIAQVGYQPLLLVVHPAVAAKSVQELVALAKNGSLSYAADNASAPHLAGELLKSMTGVGATHVPYKGNGPALTDVIGGQVPFMFNTVNTAIAPVKAGRLRALATTGAKRTPLAPEIPTMAEAGLAGFEVTAWYGVVAPAAVPRETTARIHGALASALRSADVGERLSAQGVEVVAGTQAAFDDFIRAELAKWTRIIRSAKIGAE